MPNFRFCSQARMQKHARAGSARVDFSVVNFGPNRPTKPKHAPPAPLLVVPGAPTGGPGAPTGGPGFVAVGGCPHAYKFQNEPTNLARVLDVKMSTCQDVNMSTCQDAKCIPLGPYWFSPGPLLVFPGPLLVFPPKSRFLACGQAPCLQV